MATNTLKTRIKHSYKTESDWASLNPVLLDGEVAYSLNTNGRYKVGDGNSKWSELSYAIPVTKSDIGLGNVGNFKAVSTVANQGLTDSEKSNARSNIGAGTSSFSGSYTDLTNKPTIPSVGNGTITITQNGSTKGTFTTNQSGNTTIALTDNNTTYSTMTGATSSASGSTGLVPAPASGNQAKFLRGDGTWATPTDTNTWRGIQNNLTSDSTTDSLSAAQGKALKSLVDGKSDSGHTHDNRYYTESEMDAKLNAKLNTSLKGVASGLAELDANGKVPSSQLPSFVDDVIEGYLSSGKFYKESSLTTAITGETGKIYIDLNTNKTYRWSGSAFVVISETLALGETSSTAYRGDRGATAYTHASSDTGKALSNGLYKITTSARGHVTAGTAVTKSDITGLGIPAQDTVYTHPSYTEKSSGLYKMTVDSTGHISAATAVTKDDITALGIPSSDTNTHYASGTIVNNSATATANTTSALTNGNVYLNHIENGAVKNSHKISGSGATTVTSDENGNIVISSTDNNTDTKVTNTKNTTTKAYITGTTSSSTNTGTQIFDTGVYLDSTAGRLAATSFKVGNAILSYDSTKSCLVITVN